MYHTVENEKEFLIRYSKDDKAVETFTMKSTDKNLN